MPGNPPPGYDSSRGRRSDNEDPFTITTGDNRFMSRSADVFAGLATLEQKHSAVTKAQHDNTSNDERKNLQNPEPTDNPTDPRPRSDRFRRPRLSHRPRFTPDFKKNPGQWKMYDLSDVSRDQLSEKSNSAAAFQFLQERRKLKGDKEDQKPADLSEKVHFARPASKPDESKASFPTSSSPQEEGSSESSSDKSKFQGSTRVMPEYVIGQGSLKSKQRKMAQKPAGSAGAINLDYLQEDNDDRDTESEKLSVPVKRKMVNPSDDESTSKSAGTSLPEKGLGKNVEGSVDARDEKTDHGVKFRKVSSKKGIRRRRAVDGEAGDDE